MRYSFEFKMKCVELYRKGTWVETPENVMQESFRRKILIGIKLKRFMVLKDWSVSKNKEIGR